MDSIINDHAQANKVKTFTNLFSTGERGIQQLRVQRKIDITSDPINSGKQVSFWDNKEQEYTNPSGIDAPFKNFMTTTLSGLIQILAMKLSLAHQHYADPY